MDKSIGIVADALRGVKLELLAEAYCLLKCAIKVSHDEMRTVYSDWNRGELADPLVAAAADALGLRDEDGDPLLEKVLDVPLGRALCKGAASLALELGCPAPIAAQAAGSAFAASMKDERVDASAILSGPKPAFSGERHAMIEELRKALHASILLAYSEAYSLARAADVEAGAARAALSADGSPIGAAASEARGRRAPREAILLDAAVKSRLDPLLPSLRKLCSRVAECGLYLPCFAAALSYYDGLRAAWLPANLVAALRDSLDQARYERVDRPRGETFHSEWK
jgi:6-phosphogluconate dehydrogenase